MNKIELKKYKENYNYKIPNIGSIVVIADGKNFKSITKNLNKPFDNVFSELMISTMTAVASNMHNCRYAYTASDKIYFILKDEYLGNNLQKIVSQISSMLSVKFNKLLLQFILEYEHQFKLNQEEGKYTNNHNNEESIEKRIKSFWDVVNSDPTFNVKVFSIPDNAVEDTLEFYQNMCIGNSISTLANMYLFQPVGKSRKELIIALRNETQYPWETMPDAFKFGTLFTQSGNGTCEIDTYLFSTAQKLKNKTDKYND